MAQHNYKSIGFDDRWYSFFGVLFLSLGFPLMLALPRYEFWTLYWSRYVPQSIFYITLYWIVVRVVIITSRRLFPRFKQIGLRLLFILVFVFICVAFVREMSVRLVDILFYAGGEYDPRDDLSPLQHLYIPIFLCVAIYEAIYFFTKYRQESDRRQQLEVEQITAELNNLKCQVNPNFLYDGLDTLMELIPMDQDAAIDYLFKLSKFYRFISAHSHADLIRLSVERESLKVYRDLLSVRYGKVIIVNDDLYPATDELIPPQSLQLLIDNAIALIKPSLINPLVISISQDGDEILFSHNLCSSIVIGEDQYLGLRLLRERYAQLTESEIEISRSDDALLVTIPILKYENA